MSDSAGDEILHLIGARQVLRDKVLLAVMAQDASEQIIAWTDVDKAAADVTRRRRAYDRHVKSVAAKANVVRMADLLAGDAPQDGDDDG